MWEFGTPLIIKNIFEEELDVIQCSVLHPNNNYIAAQTNKNKIEIFDIKNNNMIWYKQKYFMGHYNNGFNIKLDFTPNGKYLLSGDQNGKVYIWEWKNQQMLCSI